MTHGHITHAPMLASRSGTMDQDPASSTCITERVFARCGLLGNPSDGYHGCCISFSLANFWAEVTLQSPSPRLTFTPHPVHDSTDYEGLSQLADKVAKCGYYGGVRLLQAMAKVFWEWCRDQGVQLPSAPNFTLSYDTNIPRQAGLSGSSAICCAALSCLMRHYGVADSIPLEMRPNLVLAAERELGITAGLQDRVIQVYGGLVYMDFNEAGMQQRGHGEYARMDSDLLCLDGRPGLLHVLYADNPSDSGRVHADVRQRWLNGDKEVRAAMEEVAECARNGRTALEQRDILKLCSLMDRNFDLRRRMFGDAALGAQNIHMIELARSLGCAAKFTGSGGAALVLCPEGQPQAMRLEAAAQQHGLVLVPVQVGAASS